MYMYLYINCKVHNYGLLAYTHVHVGIHNSRSNMNYDKGLILYLKVLSFASLVR